VAVSDSVPVDPIVVLCVEAQTVAPEDVTDTLALGAAAPYLRFRSDGDPSSAGTGDQGSGSEWQMDLSYVCQGDLERFIGYDFEDTLDPTADTALVMMDGHEVRLTGRYPEPLDGPGIHPYAPWAGKARNLTNVAMGNDQRVDESQPDSLSDDERAELVRRFNACLYRSPHGSRE
jgi:hypothetical protein